MHHTQGAQQETVDSYSGTFWW